MDVICALETESASPEEGLSGLQETVCCILQNAHGLQGKTATCSFEVEEGEMVEAEAERYDDSSSDTVLLEIESVISDQPEDAQADLVALMWLERDEHGWSAPFGLQGVDCRKSLSRLIIVNDRYENICRLGVLGGWSQVGEGMLLKRPRAWKSRRMNRQGAESNRARSRRSRLSALGEALGVEVGRSDLAICSASISCQIWR